jgi:hypothetical protein
VGQVFSGAPAPATGAGAPLNTETFPRGYTFEAFVKVPADWSSADNS